MALERYSEAINYDNNNHIYYSNRSACLLNLGEFQLALDDALVSITLNSDYSRGYFRAASAYFEMRNYSEALSMLDKIESLKTNDNEAIELRKSILSKQCEIEELNNKYPSYKNFNIFFNWLDNNDVHYPKIELKYFSDDYRGIISKNKIFVCLYILK